MADLPSAQSSRTVQITLLMEEGEWIGIVREDGEGQIQYGPDRDAAGVLSMIAEDVDGGSYG